MSHFSNERAAKFFQNTIRNSRYISFIKANAIYYIRGIYKNKLIAYKTWPFLTAGLK